MDYNFKQGNYVSLNATEQKDKPVFRIADGIELWDKTTRSQAEIAIVNINDSTDTRKVYLDQLYPIDLTPVWRFLIYCAFRERCFENPGQLPIFGFNVKDGFSPNENGLYCDHKYVQVVLSVHEVQNIYFDKTGMNLFDILQPINVEKIIVEETKEYIPPANADILTYRRSSIVNSGFLFIGEEGSATYYDLKNISYYHYSGDHINFNMDETEVHLTGEEESSLLYQALQEYHGFVNNPAVAVNTPEPRKDELDYRQILSHLFEQVNDLACKRMLEPPHFKREVQHCSAMIMIARQHGV